MHGSQCVAWQGAMVCQKWGHSLTVWSFDHRKEGVLRPETLYLGCTCTMAWSTTSNSCRSQHCKCVSWHCAPLCQIWGHCAFACHWMPGVDVFCLDKVDTGCLVHTAMVKMKQTMYMHGSQCVAWQGAMVCKKWGHSFTVWSFDHHKEGVLRPETLYLGCTCTMAWSTTNNSCRSQH